jgi:AcrR family transcriptional regulator
MPELNRKPGRPKNPELELRRQAEILDAAAAVFAEQGFAAAQVQEIADRLGIGNGTVYRYFPTKEKLFLAAVERGLKELAAEMDRVMEQPLDPLAILETMIREYLKFFHRRPEMAELFIQERAAFRQHHVPLYFASDECEKQKHAEFLERILVSDRVRPMPPERFFAVIGDLLYGTVLTNLLSGRSVEPDAQAEDILDVLMNGLLKPVAVDQPKKKGKS